MSQKTKKKARSAARKTAGPRQGAKMQHGGTAARSPRSSRKPTNDRWRRGWTWERSYAVLCALMGVTLVGGYAAPPLLSGGAGPDLRLWIFLALVGVVLIAAAVGYALNTRWALWAQTGAAVAMVPIPGTLFPFVPDSYHLIIWLIPLTCLVLVLLMWRRRQGALT